MTHLLDANVLIALTVPTHLHYQPAHQWLIANKYEVAVCPITEGSLARYLFRDGATATVVAETLKALRSIPGYDFWPDDISYTDVDLGPVIGHRQVTDAYLAALARKRAARLATFDRGLAALHSDVADLINTLQ